jgi:hypothetical protein
MAERTSSNKSVTRGIGSKSGGIERDQKSREWYHSSAKHAKRENESGVQSMKKKKGERRKEKGDKESHDSCLAVWSEVRLGRM